MSAPSEAYAIQLAKIQPEGRLATSSELNPAPGGVTCHREARRMGYRAATQVKGLSPEIPVMSEADAVHLSGRQYSHNRYWRGYANPTGSETAARYQRERVGTREAHNIPLWVWVVKPLEGKAGQMVLWESDQSIVVRKQGNACGAKGLAGRPVEGDTTSRLRTGQRLSTKPKPMTCSLEGKEVFLKSRMRENCKSGSVRGFIVDSLLRRWL